MSTEKINMTPSFEAATNMCIMALESGNGEGRRIAKIELLRYGRMLDQLVKQAASEPTDNMDGE